MCECVCACVWWEGCQGLGHPVWTHFLCNHVGIISVQFESVEPPSQPQCHKSPKKGKERTLPWTYKHNSSLLAQYESCMLQKTIEVKYRKVKIGNCKVELSQTGTTALSCIINSGLCFVKDVLRFIVLWYSGIVHKRPASERYYQSYYQSIHKHTINSSKSNPGYFKISTKIDQLRFGKSSSLISFMNDQLFLLSAQSHHNWSPSPHTL